MIWILLKLMLTRWLSMKRWNNFPRIEDVSHLDNMWYVLHVSLFLAYLEEQNWNKVDKLFIIKRLIFSSFSKLVLSDINSWTKDYIKDIDSELFNKLEDKTIKFLLEYSWPQNIKDDIFDTLNCAEKTLEIDIINSARKYVWYEELKVNKKIFENAYDFPELKLKNEFKKFSEKLDSFNELIINNEYQKFLSQIRRLSYCIRWNQEIRKYPISVMSHLFLITFISYVLWMIENDEKYNMEELLLRSAYHDIPEAITWDVITPTKKWVAWFDMALEKAEIEMMDDYFFSYVPGNYKKEVFSYMLHPFDSEIWSLAKSADILSAFFEAKVEYDSNPNWAFKNMYKDLKKKCNLLKFNSVDFVMKHETINFEDDLGNIDLRKF